MAACWVDVKAVHVVEGWVVSTVVPTVESRVAKKADYEVAQMAVRTVPSLVATMVVPMGVQMAGSTVAMTVA